VGNVDGKAISLNKQKPNSSRPVNSEAAFLYIGAEMGYPIKVNQNVSKQT
jgi:hypothetical protein